MWIKCSIIVFILLPMWVKSDENVYVVNSKRPLHVVSERFLSISIDPAVLLTKINLSDVSLQMARHLSPAYVRIAGPSTEFVRYLDTDEQSKETEDPNSVTVTPSVWFAVNEWFNMANLTPVFGINDADTTMGVWNPKSILPLLEISDKFNLTCLWQLGFDCSNKTDTQYVEDLRILRHILDAFPDKKNSWKIVGSNIRKCTHRSGCRRLLDSLKSVTDFVVWEQSEKDIDILNDELAHIIFGERKNPKLWTSVPRSHNSVTFSTALDWAKEVGEAARNGFDVILRTPRVYEFFVDTPVFWFSLLYKNLVGNMVLDMRSASSNSEIDAFAYCARHQNNFIQSGAMVIMVVNHAETEQVAHIRLSALAKNMEIQSYILTSKTDVRSIYLNGEKLKSSMLQQNPLVFTPKLRRAKPSNGLSISVPGKSIGFFILPGARVTACMDEHDEMALLMEEIESDQELPLSAELAVEIKSRNHQETAVSLKQMEKELQEELETDQKFYFNIQEETHQKLDSILEDLSQNYEKQDPKFHLKIDEEARKKILERAKLIEAQRKLTESEQRLVDLSRLMLTKTSDKTHGFEISQKESSEDLGKDKIFDKSKTDVKTVKDSLPKFTIPEVRNFHNNDSKKNLKGKPKSLHDQFKEILNLHSINSLKHPLHQLPKDEIEEFEIPKLNSIHHDQFPQIDHKKLTLATKNLQEHFKEILSKSKSNHLKRMEPKEKTVDKSGEIELELTSEEVRKVLADRVKVRAAKTNIRFTNDELDEIMKKATHKLKHDHTLIARSGSKHRLRRDINMKLLNEASKHEVSKKDSNESGESSEIPNKKAFSQKKIITNPFYKRGQRKQKKLSDSSNLDTSEMENDFDLYFEDEDKESKKVISNEKKKNSVKPCYEKKLANVKQSNHDFDEEKYTRLDDYFKNAKEVQEKFDDIDFSDEDDYSNMEDEGLTRLKRDITQDKTKTDQSMGCSCSLMMGDIVKTLQSVLEGGNKDDYDQLKEKMETYDNLMKAIDKEKDTEVKSKIKPKKRRSVDGHHKYRPLCDFFRTWRPENIVLTKPGNRVRHNHTMINDLPLYQHLLLNNSEQYQHLIKNPRNNVKRSIQSKMSNLLLKESDESIDSILNRIDKNDASEAKDSEKDFQLVFPNKDKLELKNKKNFTEVIFEHQMSEKPIKDLSIKTEEPLGKKRMFQKDLSHIQIIPKNSTVSFFHHAFGHLHSFIHNIGSKIKGYFHEIFN